MSQTLLAAHYRERLARALQQIATSTQQAGISEPLQEAIHAYLSQLPDGGKRLTERFIFEQTRLMLACMLMRFGGTPAISFAGDAADVLPPYESAAAFLHDLLLLRDSLAENRGTRLAEKVDRPADRGGSHLWPLPADTGHPAATRRCTPAPSRKIAAWSGDGTLPAPLSPMTAEVVNTFRTIAELKRAG